MTIIVKLSDIVEAFDAGGEWQTYLDTETGEIVLVTDEDRGILDGDPDPDLDGYADWQRKAIAQAVQVEQQPERFLPLPHSFEIHEWDIMRRFADSVEDARQRRALLDTIHGSGAFRAFRSTLRRLGLSELWYAYRAEQFERFAKEWLQEHGIAFVPG